MAAKRQSVVADPYGGAEESSVNGSCRYAICCRHGGPQGTGVTRWQGNVGIRLLSHRKALGIGRIGMLITREWVKKHATGANSWTREQLECLGVEWPPRKGWLSERIGRYISPEKAAEFERLGAARRQTLAMKAVQGDLSW